MANPDRIWMHHDSRRVWDEAQARYQVMKAKPSVNLSALPSDQKRRVWGWLQQQHPKMAATLRDPHVQEMRTLFDADVTLDAELLQDILHEFD